MIKIRDGYQKIKFHGTAYIMPYGQNSADHTRALKLNPSSELLWDGIVQGMDEDQLVALLIEEYHAGESETALLREDTRHFISALAANGILLLTGSEKPYTSRDPLYYRIGPLTFTYYGPESLYEQYFVDFACDPVAQTDQKIYLKIGQPRYHENGNILIRTPELTICDADSEYRFLFRSEWKINEMTVSKDGSVTVAYCAADAFEQDNQEQVFHALRFAFLLLAQRHKLYAIHSASFLYKGKAWLFSGPSGTGKSTHTNLWKELYDVPLLNGDLNLLGFQGQTPVVYGLPWCGTSGIHTPETYPLGGIVFLKKAPDNRVLTPDLADQAFMLMQRSISPIWDNAMLTQQAQFCETLADHATILSLHCTKEPEAAATMKQAIDEL